MTQAMTKSERAELSSLIRKRERVMKAAARERSTTLLAEFEAQSARIYSFNEDEVWKQATLAAKEAAVQANEVILARCRELGIPSEFAPGVNFSWYGRGENAVAERRAELRRVAKAKIDRFEAEAVTRIERLSLSAQTEVVISGLESIAAKDFLERMPSIDELMPMIDAGEIKSLVDAKAGRPSRLESYRETEV